MEAVSSSLMQFQQLILSYWPGGVDCVAFSSTGFHCGDSCIGLDFILIPCPKQGGLSFCEGCLE